MAIWSQAPWGPQWREAGREDGRRGWDPWSPPVWLVVPQPFGLCSHPALQPHLPHSGPLHPCPRTSDKTTAVQNQQAQSIRLCCPCSSPGKIIREEGKKTREACGSWKSWQAREPGTLEKLCISNWSQFRVRPATHHKLLQFGFLMRGFHILTLH